MVKKNIQRIIYTLPILGFISLTGLIIYGYSKGIFASTDSLQAFIRPFGTWGIGIFILLQLLQVIVPILPGGISTVVGMLLFGNWAGLIYSYFGLIIGECIVYWLTRYYGKPFVRLILSKKKYDQFEQILTHSEKKIKKILIATLLIPFVPDDLVCLVAVLAEIPFKTYLKILLLFKFWSVATYGFILIFFIHNVFFR